MLLEVLYQLFIMNAKKKKNLQKKTANSSNFPT